MSNTELVSLIDKKFLERNLLSVNNDYTGMFIELNIPENLVLNTEKVNSILMNAEVESTHDKERPGLKYKNVLKGEVRTPKLKNIIKNLYK